MSEQIEVRARDGNRSASVRQRGPDGSSASIIVALAVVITAAVAISGVVTVALAAID